MLREVLESVEVLVEVSASALVLRAARPWARHRRRSERERKGRSIRPQFGSLSKLSLLRAASSGRKRQSRRPCFSGVNYTRLHLERANSARIGGIPVAAEIGIAEERAEGRGPTCLAPSGIATR